MIRKAVIPAAGYGTRFLPATVSMPKEMLPIVDRPVIQYVVEEAAASGLEDILIIVCRNKRSIEEHFSRQPELEQLLAAKGRTAELESIRRIPSLARIHFVWQQTASGLGDAIAYAREHVGDEAFAVLLGDTVIESPTPVTRQLMDIHLSHGGAVVALEEVPKAKVSRYGIAAGRALNERLYRLEDLVEKPAPETAPSNLAVAGRYVLVPEIFDLLDRVPPPAGEELQLTDALRVLARGAALHGLRFEGRRHDLGNKLDWLKANVAFGLARRDIGPDFQVFLNDLRDEPR